MIKIMASIFLTVGLILISWRSLKVAGSHGFYRFFAWESMGLLIILNISQWFQEPASWHQLISWGLLILAIVPLIFGVHSLVTRGKPAKQREGEPQLLAFEKTTQLIITGIYHFIRHPLYSSLLFLNWGVFFKAPGLLGGCLAGVATVFLYATARADEMECMAYFGDSYREYMKATKRFVPFLF
jgi:protein-S-isoprenylcysteine O-methyltransferase Ste14